VTGPRARAPHSFSWRAFFTRAATTFAVVLLARNVVRFRGDLGLVAPEHEFLLAALMLTWIFAALWYVVLVVNYSRSLSQPVWMTAAYGIFGLVGGIVALLPLLGLYWASRQTTAPSRPFDEGPVEDPGT